MCEGGKVSRDSGYDGGFCESQGTKDARNDGGYCKKKDIKGTKV